MNSQVPQKKKGKPDMKQNTHMQKILSSILIAIIVLYYIVNTEVPKIFFIPFLFCILAVAGKNITLLLREKKLDIPEKEEQTADTAGTKYRLLIVVISVIIAVIPLFIGIGLLINNGKNGDIRLILTGVFLIFFACTLVLTVLKLMGYFDRAKVDILQIYSGALSEAIGIGWIALKYRETQSFEKMIDAFGIWFIIPVLIIAIGIYQIVAGLKNKKA